MPAFAPVLRPPPTLCGVASDDDDVIAVADVPADDAAPGVAVVGVAALEFVASSKRVIASA
jgi:hypothetical protein